MRPRLSRPLATALCGAALVAAGCDEESDPLAVTCGELTGDAERQREVARQLAHRTSRPTGQPDELAARIRRRLGKLCDPAVPGSPTFAPGARALAEAALEVPVRGRLP